MPPTTRTRTRFIFSPVAGGTRRRTRDALQSRVATNRSQVVSTIPETLSQGDRMSAAASFTWLDGSVRYGAIQNWRRAGITATIGPQWLAANLGTNARVDISGMGAGLARGHLLARSLGGSGTDIRNLVPLAHNFTNINQFQSVEKRIAQHVLRDRTSAQLAAFGNRPTLAQAKAAVNNPAWATLLTSGYYHTVTYTVTPEYDNNSRTRPAALRFSARCEACGERVIAETSLINPIQ